MHYRVPHSEHTFEIPDEWLAFVSLDNWLRGSNFYPYDTRLADQIDVLDIDSIEPPQRDPGIEPFRKYKLVPVLFAFTSPECALPPVRVKLLPAGGQYKYRLENGFHRFYASIAVGYRAIAAIVTAAHSRPVRAAKVTSSPAAHHPPRSSRSCPPHPMQVH